MNWIEDAVLYKPNSRWVTAILIGQLSQVGFTHDPSLSAMYLTLGPSCVKLCQNQLKRAKITHKRTLFSLPLSKNVASLSHSNTTTVSFIDLYKQEKSLSQRSWVPLPENHSRYAIHTLLVAWTTRPDESWG